MNPLTCTSCRSFRRRSPKRSRGGPEAQDPGVAFFTTCVSKPLQRCARSRFEVELMLQLADDKKVLKQLEDSC